MLLTFANTYCSLVNMISQIEEESRSNSGESSGENSGTRSSSSASKERPKQKEVVKRTKDSAKRLPYISKGNKMFTVHKI